MGKNKNKNRNNSNNNRAGQQPKNTEEVKAVEETKTEEIKAAESAEEAEEVKAAEAAEEAEEATVPEAEESAEEETASEAEESAEEETTSEAEESAEGETAPEEKADAKEVNTAEKINLSKSEKTSEKEKTSDKNKKEKKEKKEKPIKNPEKKAAKKARRELKARAFRRGWFSVVLVILFIAAVVLVNVIASTLVEKIPALSIDMTGEDSFSLTEDTLEFLSGLDRDITLYVLADETDYVSGGEYFIQANELYHAYANASDRITLKYVDLSSNPTFTSDYSDETISAYDLILKSEDDYEHIVESDMFEFDSTYYYYYGEYVITGSNVEENVTSAILNLTLDEKPKVTFITDITTDDYSAFQELLENNGFETEEVSPATGTISDDTSVVVLYSPTTDLTSEFVDSINEFLLNDGEYGKQLLYFPTYTLIELPNIDSLLEEWGLSVDLAYAYEQDTNYLAPYGSYYYLFASQYADTTYTAGMNNSNLPFCFIEGYTRTVSILDSSMASALLTMTDQGQVLYYDAETDDTPTSDDLVDNPSGAVAAISTKSGTSDDDETETDSSNVIVIGSVVSATSALLEKSTYGNASYMVSLLNTVTGRGDVGITIETKTLDGEELGITTAQINSLTVVLVVVIPIIILIAGIVIFIKRRNM